MKRFLTFLMLLLMLATSTVKAAQKPDDLTGLAEYASTYFEGKKPMLNGLNLYNYGIYSDLTANLDALQVAVLTSNFEEAKKIVHTFVDGWDRGLSMKTQRANIWVFGTPDKNGVYKKVVIGIGLPGRLIYMYLEGKITGNDLGVLLIPYQT